MLTRKELSAAYGKIESKYRRVRNELAELSLTGPQHETIDKILNEAQSAEGRALHDEPVKDKA